jgi:hypothetical protein
MNTLEIDADLQHRLTTIGTAFDAAPALPITPRMESPSRRSRRTWGRNLLLVGVAGAVAGGGLLAAGPRTDDPIVGVIPKNLKASDIRTISSQQPRPGEEVRHGALVVVDGVDAVVGWYRGRTFPLSSAETPTTIQGVEVFLATKVFFGAETTLLPGVTARWTGSTGLQYVAYLRNDVAARAAVERLVVRSINMDERARFSAQAITEIGRWTETSQHLTVVGGGPLLVVDEEGVTRVRKVKPQQTLSSQRSDIPAELIPRVGALTRPQARARARFGDFVIDPQRPAAELRTVRLSELRRLTKTADRLRASKIPKTKWKRLTKKLEFSDAYGGVCVRSRTDAACGEYVFNRLVDSTWVYSTFDAATVTKVDGKPITGITSEATLPINIYVIPGGATTVETSYIYAKGTRYAEYSERPDF